MKLLLADPPEMFLQGQGATRQVQPLGLACVGAAVQDLAQVRFLLPDTRAYVGDDPWQEIAQALIAEQPDVLGITAVTANFAAAAQLAAVARKVLPELLIVLGGVHASTDPEGALRGAPAVDLVVRGEGEETLRQILEHWQEVPRGSPQRSQVEWSQVAGVWYRSDGQICAAPPRPPLADLDAWPLPLRQGFVWPQDIQPAFYQALITLRGCPYQCIYCAVPSLDSSRTRYRSVDRVMAEIDQLRQRHQANYLFFHDSVFTLHRRRTLELAVRLAALEPKVPFCIQTRADRLDQELLEALIKAGLHQVFFGVESGDPHSLERIRKAMPLAVIRDAVQRVRDAGVRCSGFFMIGWPWDDAESIRRSIDFAVTLPLDAISLFSATPLPGTELWRISQHQQMPESIDFRRPQVNLTALSDAAYAELYAEASARVDRFNQQRMGERFVAPAWLQAVNGPREC
jgi:radical SAM superfamily enzyme YgiQ (UPF0313 family)